MNIFMISFDRALVGEGEGDVVERHRSYVTGDDSLSIVVVAGPDFKHQLLSENVEVYPTKARTIFGHTRAIFGYFFSIRKHAGIDLLVTQDLGAPVAYLLKIITRLPLIVNVHGVWWDRWFMNKRWWHRLYLPFLMFVLKRADAVRVVSEGLKEQLIERGINDARVSVIPTPVDVNRFVGEDESRLQSFRSKFRCPCVFTAGRLENEKGFDVLLNAWEKVVKQKKDARLLIAGDGSERDNLIKIIKEKDLERSVLLLGNLPSEDLPKYYHAAALVVLTSRSESFGKVLVEAGAARKPAVATKTLGAQSIIQDGKTGFLVPIEDTEFIAEKILFLLSNDERREEMGREAQEHVLRKFDGEKNVELIRKLWRGVVVK